MNGHASRLVAAALVAVALVAASCGGGGSGSEPPPADGCSSTAPACASLRSLARHADLLVGAAVTSGQIAEGTTTGRLVADQFGSVTPEYEGTWTHLEPHEGDQSFGALDAIVAFARRHHLGVRGHALVWDRKAALPGWVRAIDDPTRLRAALDQHVRTVVARYAGRVDRWDVVNEPLQTEGDRLDGDHLLPVLGRSYIAEAFRVARAADPSASLWLNENNVERDAAKARALVDLVRSLRDDDVPIDGVGLQTHLLSGRPTAPGVLAGLVRDLRALGVEVAVTELDVPRPRSGSTSRQAVAYRRVASECREAGCSEITVWGVDNSHTWLDKELGRSATDPLLFDRRGDPTAAYRAFTRGLGS